MQESSLNDFICVASSKPNYGDFYEIDGVWLHVKVPLKEWPMPLRKRYGREIKILLRELSDFYNEDSYMATENVVEKEKIVLCEDVEFCNNKACKCNPNCVKNMVGVCSSATMMANGGKAVRLETLAFFMGITKQRVAQIYKDAQKELVDLITNDPVLSEICKKYGIKPPSF